VLDTSPARCVMVAVVGPAEQAFQTFALGSAAAVIVGAPTMRVLESAALAVFTTPGEVAGDAVYGTDTVSSCRASKSCSTTQRTACSHGFTTSHEICEHSQTNEHN